MRHKSKGPVKSVGASKFQAARKATYEGIIFRPSLSTIMGFSMRLDISELTWFFFLLFSLTVTLLEGQLGSVNFIRDAYKSCNVDNIV